jgi:acetyl-CoA carboxylase carboxyl transferase subunit beta
LPLFSRNTKETSDSSKEISPDLWIKCPQCREVIYRKTLEENLKVCSKCGYHHKLTAWERIELLVDKGTFQELDFELLPADPLNIGKSYAEKLKEDQQKTNLRDAILTGTAQIEKHPVVLGVMDFHFRGGSMGSVVGEKVTRALEHAVLTHKPCVMVTASGGARMQEGILSLMQMAKTSAAAAKLHEAGLMYLCVLTDPTTAGVAASFASLGDIILAEPKALIGFTGARVIEETIHQKLPAGFQESEFLLKHGMIDIVVERKNLKSLLASLLAYGDSKNERGSHGI